MITGTIAKSQDSRNERSEVQNYANNAAKKGQKQHLKHQDTKKDEYSKNRENPLQEALELVRKKEQKKVRSNSYQALNILQKNELVSERIQNCGKPLSQYVEGRENKFKELAIGKIETCSSVHSCPVCRNKIKTGREEELSMIEKHIRKTGYQIYMATFTARHGLNDDLKTIVGSSKTSTGFLGSWRIFTKSHQYKKIKSDFAIEHYIRVTEDTLSVKTGWHFHFHVWFITKKKINNHAINDWAKRMYKLWSKSSVKAGLKKPSRMGFDLRLWTEQNNENYLLKSDWSASKEIMGIKNDGKSGFNIYQLERMLIDTEARQANEIGENFLKAKIKERSKALKGTRLLTYSPSLRDIRNKLFPKDKTDEDLSHMDVKETTLKFLFGSKLYWRLWYKGIIGDLKTMYAFEKGGVENIVQFINAFFPDYSKDIVTDEITLRKYSLIMEGSSSPDRATL